MDTLGLIVALVVHAASEQDRDGAKRVFWVMAWQAINRRLPRLQLIWADGGYAGKLIEWVKLLAGWTLQIVKRSDDTKGFKVLPKRWIVERTFAWLGKYRLLAKEYEGTIASSEADIYLAMTHLMVRRLAKA